MTRPNIATLGLIACIISIFLPWTFGMGGKYGLVQQLVHDVSLLEQVSPLVIVGLIGYFLVFVLIPIGLYFIAKKLNNSNLKAVYTAIVVFILFLIGQHMSSNYYYCSVTIYSTITNQTCWDLLRYGHIPAALGLVLFIIAAWTTKQIDIQIQHREKVQREVLLVANTLLLVAYGAIFVMPIIVNGIGSTGELVQIAVHIATLAFISCNYVWYKRRFYAVFLFILIMMHIGLLIFSTRFCSGFVTILPKAEVTVCKTKIYWQMGALIIPAIIVFLLSLKSNFRNKK